MKKTFFYALSAVIAVAVAVALVLGGGPSDPDPGNPELVSAVAEPTSTSLYRLGSIEEIRAIVLSGVEEALTEEAAERSTTTTSSTTTSTTLAPQPAKKPKKDSPTTLEVNYIFFVSGLYRIKQESYSFYVFLFAKSVLGHQLPEFI